MISDELVNTYQTPWSESGNGVNYLSRSKLNTFLNGETDDVITGNGPTHIEQYSFQHLVAGQLPAAEWVMQPAPHGSHKRLTFVTSEDKPRSNNAQKSTSSQRLLRLLHDWMQSGPLMRKSTHSLDNYARSIYDSAQAAVDAFLSEEESVNLPEALLIKLGFADTDILRATNVQMRYVQMLESMRFPESKTHERTQANVYEMSLGIRAWLRQIHVHCAYYKYYLDKKSEAQVRGARENEQVLAQAMAAAGPVRNPALYLQGMDKFMHTVIRHPKSGQKFNTHNVNLMVKNFKQVRDSDSTASEFVEEVVRELLTAELIKECYDDSKRRGRKTKAYRKATWEEVQDSAEGKTVCDRLHLGSDDFPA